MTTIQDAIKNLQERIAHEQSRIKFLRETYPAESEGFALAQQTIARCYGAIQPTFRRWGLDFLELVKK